MKLVVLLGFILVSFSVHSKDELSWCAYYNWAPWIYPKGDSYDGILIEELRQFEKDHNIITKPVVIENWKRCQVEVGLGHVDMLLGAYITREREVILDFLKKPLFTNNKSLSAFSSVNNTRKGVINNLSDLAKLKLVDNRGISHGEEIDKFIDGLNEGNLLIVNSLEQVLQMVHFNRSDYFFSTDLGIKKLVDRYRENIFELELSNFKKIYTVVRETKAYVAFPKGIKPIENIEGKWIESLNNYYNSVDIQQRIDFHNVNSKKHLN